MLLVQLLVKLEFLICQILLSEVIVGLTEAEVGVGNIGGKTERLLILRNASAYWRRWE